MLGMPALPTSPRGTGHLRGDESFPDAARRSLTDTQLRRNLGKATRTIRGKRAAVVAELPDWEELREAGRQLKVHTMAHLPDYLVQLEEAVTARGGVVHWARDAEEANRIVVDLVRATGADEVVKVKSMATQEIALNEALEAAGIAAFETDLAELIVQLGHDKPSHILVPAIHRNRAEIREIFLREMADVDPELSDEPAALAAAARRHLRRKFLSAKVAVSGANFAVAETGTLAVVESEGNGRMCLTLPETLITVMGIEKLVPRAQDLEVFLQLLPRSSTGERMNPYTSMWTGVTPGDGPQAFHLVLLDNGRTAVLVRRPGPRRPELHPLQRLPQRLPGLRAGRRARLRLGLPRPDRGDPVPAADRHRGQRLAAVRVLAVRRLLRRRARSRSTSRAILVHLRAEHTETYAAEHRLPSAEATAMAAAAWVMRNPTRWTLALRSGRLGRVLGRSAGSSARCRCRWRRSGRRPATSAGRRSRPSATGGPPSTRPPHRSPTGRARRVGGPVSAREEVLARIRAAHAAAPPPDLPYATLARDYRTTSELDHDALVERLVDRLLDYKALVRRCSAGRAAGDGRGGAARAGGAPAGRAGRDLSRRWLAGAGRRASRCRPTGRDRAAPAPWPSSTSVDGVLSACAVAVAETGTLVLDGGAGQGRRVISLIPDYHLCVVLARPGRGRRAAGRARARPHPADDHDQRAERDQRHRAEPRRGRARTAHPRGGPGRRA